MGKFRRSYKAFDRRVLRPISYLFMLAFLSIMSLHGYHTWDTRHMAGQWEERVLIIESELYYKALDPFVGAALGFSLPFFPVAYINRHAVERAGVDLDGIIRHEAKHLEQRATLGLKAFLQADSWKLEGMAEYARGGTTVDLCNPDPGAMKQRLAYREYFVVVSYLIGEQGLTEEEIYAHRDYPLAEALTWLKQARCSAHPTLIEAIRPPKARRPLPGSRLAGQVAL